MEHSRSKYLQRVRLMRLKPSDLKELPRRQWWYEEQRKQELLNLHTKESQVREVLGSEVTNRVGLRPYTKIWNSLSPSSTGYRRLATMPTDTKQETEASLSG